MPFDPDRAAIRFGCGLSPRIASPGSVEEMLTALAGPDRAAERFPIAGFEVVREDWNAWRAFRRQERKAQGEVREAAQQGRIDMMRRLRRDAAGWFRHSLLRRALTENGFRERLAAFWADHFTAVGKNAVYRYGFMSYAEDAIRPHVAGSFADMLKSAVLHPFLLVYFDQHASIGPNSIAGRAKGGAEALIENLAREVLELHTLGVDGPYDQTDVHELSRVMAGVSLDPQRRFRFSDRVAEPGEKRVLGRVYGGDAPALADVEAVLEDLAAHPATADHLARKLAVHFVGDTPDPGMVAAMRDAYLASDGALLSVYEAMLRHPAAWAAEAGNVKQPMDFIGSALRALDLTPRHIPDDQRGLMRQVIGPMTLMGQVPGQPLGPDGWPEGDAAWITPQRMAARLQWGMTMPFKIKRLLPDPREFVEVALGGHAPEPVRFAARAAETRAEGVGMVLASPAFQRT